jgi:hypothetical protein
MKYKFVETQGCLYSGFTINDEEIQDVPREKQKEIVDYLCEQIKDGFANGSMSVLDIVKTFQVHYNGMEKESCDQCGDRVYWDIWEL